MFQVKLQNLLVETKRLVNSPVLYILDIPEKLYKCYQYVEMYFPNKFAYNFRRFVRKNVAAI